jgi:hypothetical protein
MIAPLLLEVGNVGSCGRPLSQMANLSTLVFVTPRANLHGGEAVAAGMALSRAFAAGELVALLGSNHSVDGADIFL